jgi:phosphoserine aminotransferase
LDFPGVEVRLVVPQPKEMSTSIPSKAEWTLSEDSAYCYICSNETIEGVRFKEFPETSVPLIIDMSSDFLSRPIKKWSKIGCIFASAQKNFSIAGMSVVIVRSDLLTRNLKPFCPLTLDYRVQVKFASMYNTPPVFPIYIANVMFKWLDKRGGVEVMQRINHEKARKLYAAIDRSRFLENRVPEGIRSDMNIPFFRVSSDSAMDKATDSIFANFCAKRGLVNLSRFASGGGFRASIYNAMSEDGVHELVKAIDEFPRFEKMDEDSEDGGSLK